MQVIGDSLGKILSEKMGCDFVPVETRTFPDGEVNFRILSENLDPDVVLLLRKKRDQDVNAYLAQLYFLAKTIHNADSSIHLIMPYFVYARQDEAFRKGEPVSSQYVADLFDPLIESFTTVTAHTHRRDSIQPMFRHAKARNISGISALSRALPKLDDAFILGPDTESIVWSKEMADYTGTKDYGAFKKIRDFATGEIKITAEDFDFKGRKVVLVDDMVSTGGTTIKASEYALKMGAKELYLTFVHPLLVGDALEKLRKLNPKAIISTDTLESPVSTATVVPELVKNLKGL